MHVADSGEIAPEKEPDENPANTSDTAPPQYEPAPVLEPAAWTGVALVVTLSAAIVKRVLLDQPRKLQPAEVPYWLVMLAATAVGVRVADEGQRGSRLLRSVEAAEQRQRTFETALDARIMSQIGDATELLAASANELSEFEEGRGHEAAVRSQLALAHERLAYAESREGCVYVLDRATPPKVLGKRVGEGADISAAPKKFHGAFFRCTDVARPNSFRAARTEYRRVDIMLDDVLKYPGLITPGLLSRLSGAARSNGYFNVCAALREDRGEDDSLSRLGLARTDFEVSRRFASGYGQDLADRAGDATAKAMMAGAMQAMHAAEWGRSDPECRPLWVQSPNDDAAPPFAGEVMLDLPERKRQAIRGVMNTPGCAGVDGLALVRFSHWDTLGDVRLGELTVADSVAEDVLSVMWQLYNLKYRIEQARGIEDFMGDDGYSMRENNTSAFNCRRTSGNARELSQHALGLALDLNPLYNPFVVDGTASPAEGALFVQRDIDAPEVIRPDSEVVAAFAGIGWEWGGNWQSVLDYQHFSRDDK